MTDIRAMVRAKLTEADGLVLSRAGLAFRYQLAGEDIPIEFDDQESYGWAFKAVQRPRRPSRRREFHPEVGGGEIGHSKDEGWHMR